MSSRVILEILIKLSIDRIFLPISYPDGISYIGENATFPQNLSTKTV